VKADVSANDCYSLIDTALKRFGNVNGLVNSAGLADRAARCWTPASSSGTVSSHQYARPIPVNEGVVRHLVETGQPGSIVNILSMVADCAQSYLTPVFGV
jgi:NAD(P)-dependent dehydrogenase (short-subunit alcohol dehydrogenase family)